MSFKRLEADDITLSADSIAAPVWSDGQAELTTFQTQSTEVASEIGNYFYRIYNGDPTTTGSSQFSIAMGNKQGFGAALFTGTEDGKSPTSVVYGQFRNLVFGDEDRDFMFDGTNVSDTIYVISIDRARFKEKLLPASLELELNGKNLTDDSRTNTTVSYTDAGRVFNLVSGSAGVQDSADPNTYGYVLPDVGLIIVDGRVYPQDGSTPESVIQFAEPTTAENGTHLTSFKDLFTSFTLRSEETVTSNFVFVRVRNSEFNYSTNPSYITGSGELKHDVMINTPQTYITTVGLYNDNNDLLGVAKLSKPLLKDFTKEALIRIKLDY